MKKMFFSILIFTYSITIFKAQSNFIFEMEVVSKQRLGAIEPLVYELTLKNGLAVDTQVVQLPWNSAYRPIIEFRRRGQLKWKYVPDSELREECIYSVNWTPPASLKEGRIIGEQVFREEFVLSPVVGADTSKNYLFKKNGVYQLRSVYFPQGDKKGTPIYSNVVTVQIAPYKGEDKQAYEFLMGLPVPHVIFAYLITKGYGFSNIDPDPLISCREIIEKFPSSQFAPWAKYYLARREEAKSSVLNEEKLRLIGTLTSQAFQETSDERLKKLIVELQNILGIEN